MSYLDKLEEESLLIIDEALSKFNNPCFLYSIGKDSSVILHLINKLIDIRDIKIMHIDTTWKFKEMIEFRNKIEEKYSTKILTYTNEEVINKSLNPFTMDTTIYTNISKTEALKQAIKNYNFDALICGARRDEEKSRSKEKIFSFRNEYNIWNPRDQRPELWRHYNIFLNNKENMRVFPLSNWTELDVWLYIKKENIEVNELYFSKERKVVFYNGMYISADQKYLPENLKENIITKNVRYRTLGCYPLTGSIDSKANNIDDIINEISLSKNNERISRAIDKDKAFSMELKKIEGYF